jgi:hypothetical protein
MQRPVLILLVLAAWLSSGCGGRAIPSTDGGTSHDGLGPGDGATGFCFGTAPKASLNGAPLTVLRVTGEPGPPMSCCFAPTLRFVVKSADGKTRELVAMTKYFVSSPVTLPATVDLAKLPAGWDVSVNYHPCSPPTCSLMDHLSTQEQDRFQGSARLEGPGFGKDRVTLCLTASEGKPNSQLHSVQLYASRVEVTWK